MHIHSLTVKQVCVSLLYQNLCCVSESWMDIRQEESNGGSGGGTKSSYLCRQSSTRWIPTAEQIRILRELYYNNGVRSPNTEQIQKISARLRQYGKIEGKNVFYWFQNHKARERQKKRLGVDLAVQRNGGRMASCDDFPSNIASSFLVGSSTSGHGAPAVSGVSSFAGGSVLTGGQISGIGYAPVLLERGSFRERYLESSFCSGGSYMAGTVADSYGCFSHQESDGTDGNEVDVETLQLFPLRGREESEIGSGRKEAAESYPSWYFGDAVDVDNDRVGSLELTLGSFPARDGYMGRFESVDAGFRLGS